HSPETPRWRLMSTAPAASSRSGASGAGRYLLLCIRQGELATGKDHRVPVLGNFRSIVRWSVSTVEDNAHNDALPGSAPAGSARRRIARIVTEVFSPA